MAVLTIAAATASAGIVIGCITITGLGVKLAIIITHLSGNSLLVALCLVWLVAVLLGCRPADLGCVYHDGGPAGFHSQSTWSG